MDNIFLNMCSILLDGSTYKDRCIKRSEILNYTIDTAYTSDYGFETAIWLNDNDMIIVERYETKKLASAGHNKWCDFCKTKPQEAYSVQCDEVQKF